MKENKNKESIKDLEIEKICDKYSISINNPDTSYTLKPKLKRYLLWNEDCIGISNGK